MSLTETLTWIPVSERLPDSDITVLLFRAAADEPVWLGFHDGSDNRWYYIDGSLSIPTHWAEMPEGPQ